MLNPFGVPLCLYISYALHNSSPQFLSTTTSSHHPSISKPCKLVLDFFVGINLYIIIPLPFSCWVFVCSRRPKSLLLLHLLVSNQFHRIMGSEQFFGEATMNFGYEADDSVKQKKHSNSCPEVVATEHVNGCFDCNICIESAHDPVVTLCGHLYCWPCIYKWIQVQSCSSSDSHEQPKCPVCKAYISNASLVPLYGRGMSSSESETRKRQMDNVVPHRPSALGMNSPVSHATSMSSADQQLLRSNPFLQQQAEPFSQQQQPQQIQSFHQFSNPFGTTYTSMGASRYGNAAMSSLFSPMIGLFGEVVAQGMFGSSSGSSSSTSMFAYTYPNSYSTNGSPRRMRRQELQMEKSLGRVLSFLLCGLVLCLLLF